MSVAEDFDIDFKTKKIIKREPTCRVGVVESAFSCRPSEVNEVYMLVGGIGVVRWNIAKKAEVGSLKACGIPLGNPKIFLRN